MSSVPDLFTRFSRMDLEMELELGTQLETELEMDLEMVGFHVEIQFLHSLHTHKCNQINF